MKSTHGLRTPKNLCETYWRLVDRFRQTPGGIEGHHVYPRWLHHSDEEVIFVSQSQHACLHYLIWSHEKTKESAAAFNAAATSWRRVKPSLDDLYVVNYNLIEEVGAWSTQSMKRPKNLDWQKADCDHPLYAIRRKKGLKTVAQQLADGTPAAARKWVITNPLGEQFEVYNLASVLRDLGVSNKTKLTRQGYSLEKK